MQDWKPDGTHLDDCDILIKVTNTYKCIQKSSSFEVSDDAKTL